MCICLFVVHAALYQEKYPPVKRRVLLIPANPIQGNRKGNSVIAAVQGVFFKFLSLCSSFFTPDNTVTGKAIGKIPQC
jgi:hypothetical protein